MNLHNRLFSWSLLTLIAACSSGTDDAPIADAPIADATEREDVRAVLSTYGYDTGDFEIDGDYVRIEGDVVFERDALLAGEYDRRFRLHSGPNGASTLVDKGYFSGW